MDAAAAFLHRKERDAIARRRKKEPLKALVPVVDGDRTGLLAITPARVLYASRRRLGTPVRQWHRRQTAVRFERRRYGVVHVGGRRFELMSRDDAHAVERALAPAARPPGPSPGARVGPAGPMREPLAAPGGARPADPLAHRGTLEHQARLRQMHAKGLLSKAELEWHLAT